MRRTLSLWAYHGIAAGEKVCLFMEHDVLEADSACLSASIGRCSSLGLPAAQNLARKCMPWGSYFHQLVHGHRPYTASAKAAMDGETMAL